MVVALTAIATTIAAFAKSFVPFYLVGSTSIFILACLAAILLIVVRWREVLTDASYATNVLVLIATLYAIIVVNFLFKTSGDVPFTYLIGMLAFHGLFFLFGFSAARGLNQIFAVLLAQAAVFLIYIVGYTFRFGDPMSQGYLGDVFGAGEPSRYITFHVVIGTTFGIAILVALGLATAWVARLSVYAMIPLALWFMFHIASRTSLVALVCSLAFLVGTALWVRSKRSALLAIALLCLLALPISAGLYRYMLDAADNPRAPDAISRTIREVQSDNPEYRLQIWQRTWQRIMGEPSHFLFGRGIGSYAIDEGFGPPTWLLDKSPKHYPHNIHLEVLYEFGLAGFSIFALITFFPLVAALQLWGKLSLQARAATSIYLFYLVSCGISGSFSYSYDFQFFLGLAIGVIALKRRELAVMGEAGPVSSGTPLQNWKSPGPTAQKPN